MTDKASRMMNALHIEENTLRAQGMKSAANAIRDFLNYASDESLVRMADMLSAS